MEQLLFESASSLEQQIDNDNKTMHLVGRLMVADETNVNKRIYSKEDLQKSVDLIKAKINEGDPIMGELDHPDTMKISLKNVSHTIVDAWMDGNCVYGKVKLMNTPSGLTAQKLIEGGARLGISSRGRGEVNPYNGKVSNFVFVTLDLVATPSGPGCKLDHIFEDVVTDDSQMLLEEVEIRKSKNTQMIVEDTTAQEYFTNAILDFLRNLKK